jgi:hypothetical protein
MRIITTQTEAYKFEELDEKAQERAIQNLCDINIDFDWYDCTYEDAERIGLKIESFDLDRNIHATGKLLTNSETVAEKIIKEHGVDCSTWKLASNYLFDRRKIKKENFDADCSNELTYKGEGLLEDLETQFEKDLLKAYSCILQNEYEYLTSREAIIETIQANEYEFTKGGKLV